MTKPDTTPKTLKEILYQLWRDGRDNEDRYIKVAEAEKAIQQLIDQVIDTRKTIFLTHSNLEHGKGYLKGREDLRAEQEQALLKLLQDDKE